MPARSLLAVPALALASLAVVAGPAGAVPNPTRSVVGTPARAPSTCRGQQAVIVPPVTTYDGTPGDDVLVVATGTEVYAGYGNDIICVYGTTNHGATIYAGYGDDQIVAYSGSHTLLGQSGRDTIVANGGAMEVDAGDDHDVVNVGGTAEARVWGGSGDDIISGSPGDDDLYGGFGADLVLGWGGDDTVYGDEGDDDLRGGAGWDGHSGGIGADRCTDTTSPTNGGMFGECEVVTSTPATSGGFAAS